VPKTFPPKFSQDILYPAIHNLDEIDMSGSPVGDVPLGAYFNVSFGDLPNNATPSLSYGKHGFRISINPIVSGYPNLKQGSNIIFEVKDSNGLVIFSDTTPLHSGDNLKFMGYLWIKQDPLRTYEQVVEGYATMTIVGVSDIPNPHWRNLYNVRSNILLNLDMTIQSINDNNTVQLYYNNNISPIIFKNPNEMTSGSGGLFMSESLVSETEDEDGNTISKKSLITISASNLQTFSGKVHQVNVDYWKSGSIPDSTEPNWQPLGNRPLINTDGTPYSTIFEENIDKDYAEGINPISAEWSHEIDYDIAPSGLITKMKFRLRFANANNQSALNTYPFSGSSSTGHEFSLEYPGTGPVTEGYGYWLEMEGSGMTSPGSTVFGASNRVLVTTTAGQFSFGQAPFSSKIGQKFDSNGDPIFIISNTAGDRAPN